MCHRNQLADCIDFSCTKPSKEADNVIPDAVWVTKEILTLIEDEAGHLPGLPELLIKVLSPSAENIRRDREARLKLYSSQGAKEYWISDRFAKPLEIYRREDGRLVLTKTLTTEDTLRSPLLPGFSCLVSQFFQ